MIEEVLSVSTDTDQEKVARTIQRYDFLAVPWWIWNSVRGIVTVDDVIDVIEQEATRDLYAAGAVQAGDDDDYFSSNLSTSPAPRCLACGAGAGQLLHFEVIAANEDVLQRVVLLAAFIPLLGGTEATLAQARW